MKYQLSACALLFVTLTAAAQVASHAPSVGALPKAQVTTLQVSNKPVAKVNGTVLTDRDLLQEMYTIFPYAQQHGGFPKGQEAEIRRGAMDMIIFDELVYQEAVRHNVTIAPERINRNVREFRKQFHTEAEFQGYLKADAHGNIQVLRNKVKRALMIDAVVKTEIYLKSAMSPAELRAYYDKNHAKYAHGETYSIQTISIIAPRNANPEQLREARKRADEALLLARATKSYEDFGVLAERVSEDDFHVKMGDHKAVEASQLPPEVVAALKNLSAGQVTNLLQLGPNYTIVRLNAHSPAGVAPFEEVKATLRDEQQKIRYNQLRSALATKLKKTSKVEIL
jgi:parvulin-like peptidyl-prolyl isomerase